MLFWEWRCEIGEIADLLYRLKNHIKLLNAVGFEELVGLSTFLNHMSFINVLALAELREFGDIEHFRSLKVHFILFEFRLGMFVALHAGLLGLVHDIVKDRKSVV